MSPTVAEVVEVLETPSRLRGDLVQCYLPLRFEIRIRLVRIGLAIATAADFELVQMRVLPPHGLLENGVKAVEGDGARHQDSSPDGRFQQGDLEPVDRSRLVLCGETL